MVSIQQKIDHSLTYQSSLDHALAALYVLEEKINEAEEDETSDDAHFENQVTLNLCVLLQNKGNLTEHPIMNASIIRYNEIKHYLGLMRDYLKLAKDVKKENMCIDEIAVPKHAYLSGFASINRVKGRLHLAKKKPMRFKIEY